MIIKNSTIVSERTIGEWMPLREIHQHVTNGTTKDGCPKRQQTCLMRKMPKTTMQKTLETGIASTGEYPKRRNIGTKSPPPPTPPAPAKAPPIKHNWYKIHVQLSGAFDHR